jgi:cytochrome c oxidase assembly protein subunit 15
MSFAATRDLRRTAGPRGRRAAHVLAILAAALTLPLLFVGGSVTTYHVGLAVPDWPTTFGTNMFLYDFWNAPFGVRVEHIHRLYGAAVGVATVALAAWLLAFEPRRSVKLLGMLALAAVIVQGILGGTRVTQVSTFLAAVHGCTGQAFFALAVILCVVTGRAWQQAGTRSPDSDQMRVLSLVAVFLVACQIVLGSWLRHYSSLAALVSHATLALGVWASALVLLVRSRQPSSAARTLGPLAWVLLATVNLQILLGLVSFWYLLPIDGTPRPTVLYQAVLRTAHQTNGALVLAAALVLSLRAFRHLCSPAHPLEDRSAAGAKSGFPHERKPLDWEAVV